jgi:hypothetical protein
MFYLSLSLFVFLSFDEYAAKTHKKKLILTESKTRAEEEDLPLSDF